MKFTALSIRHKITLITLLVPGIALALGCLGSLILYFACLHWHSDKAWIFVWLLIIAALAFLFALWASLRLGRQVTRPLEALAAQIETIARTGDHTQRVTCSASDEVGSLASSINQTLHALESKTLALQASEARLQHSQRQLLEAQAMANIGSWILDRRPGNNEWSAEMFRLHGLPTNSLKPPSPEEFFQLVHPEDQERMRSHFGAIFQGAAQRQVEYRTHPARGPVRILQALVAVNRDENGQISHVNGTCTDITRQREEESQRQVLEAQLIQAQKLDALGTLAGGIAHDFNNILSAVIGNVDIAISEDCDPDTLRESLDGISKASRRARDLVKRILTFGRRQESCFETLDLNELAIEIMQLLRSTLPANISLEYLGMETPLRIRADASQIHQVLMNLATNARQALPRSGGKISLRLDETKVDETLCASHPDLMPGRYLSLSVHDDGCGISPEMQARIFEPFFTTKPKGSGTGLGLSVVHGIMTAHRGMVRVASAPGQGSCFTLLFPAVEHSGENSHAADTATPPRASGQRILFIDDEEPLVNLATRLLTRQGYQVSGYTSAEQALAAFRAAPDAFDLVITDLSMPGLSGLDVTREVLQLRPELPVVLASGYLTEEEASQARRLGVRELVQKPNVVENLTRILHRLLA